MFGNLFKKKDATPTGPELEHITYASTTAKWNACAELAKAEPGTHFITWFTDSCKALRDRFEQAGLNPSRVHEARHFHSAMLSGGKGVLAESSPLYEKEKTLVAGWPQDKVMLYCSLDEAFFRYFGGERILDLVTKLGLKEDEPISHPLISRSVRTAQEKIAKKIGLEQSASSQAEWMARNLG